jgi:hypothetical protein
LWARQPRSVREARVPFRAAPTSSFSSVPSPSTSRSPLSPTSAALGQIDTAIEEAAKRGKPCWWLEPALPLARRPRRAQGMERLESLALVVDAARRLAVDGDQIMPARQSSLIELSKQLPKQQRIEMVDQRPQPAGSRDPKNEMARTVVENSGDGCPMQRFHQNRRNLRPSRRSEASAFPSAGRQPARIADHPRSGVTLAAPRRIVSMCASAANHRTGNHASIVKAKIILPGPLT